MTLQARNTAAAKVQSEMREEEQRAELLRSMALRRARFAAIEADHATRKTA